MTQKHHQYTQQLRLEAYISLKTSDRIMWLILISVLISVLHSTLASLQTPCCFINYCSSYRKFIRDWGIKRLLKTNTSVDHRWSCWSNLTKCYWGWNILVLNMMKTKKRANVVIKTRKSNQSKNSGWPFYVHVQLRSFNNKGS